MTESEALEKCLELEILIPTKPTLRRYGLTLAEWLEHLADQDFSCAVCGRLPSVSPRYKGRRFVTDHEHVRNWTKMPDDRRKLYVRGLVCYWCNKTYLGRGITLDIACGVVLYLERYLDRRPE